MLVTNSLFGAGDFASDFAGAAGFGGVEAGEVCAAAKCIGAMSANKMVSCWKYLISISSVFINLFNCLRGARTTVQR